MHAQPSGTRGVGDGPQLLQWVEGAVIGRLGQRDDGRLRVMGVTPPGCVQGVLDRIAV